MAAPLSLCSVHAILILSSDDGTRIMAKYFSPVHAAAQQKGTEAASLKGHLTNKDQGNFEKGLLEKTNKANGDIIMFDARLVSYKAEGDIIIYVVGDEAESELLLYNTVLALRDSLSIILK